MANGIVDLAIHQWSEDSKTSWIQIMSTGEWDHPREGKIRITRDDLQRFADNFDRKVRGVNLFVDVSHKPDDGAVGEFKRVEVRGDQLWAEIAWTEKGAELIQSRTYNYFSPEFAFRWTDPATGQVHRDVLFGGALTNRPFLRHMERIALSETADMFQVKFADGEPYDPDHDDDDDSTTNPEKNPDWMDDIKRGITPWSKATPEQQKALTAKGITKEMADKAHADFMRKHPHLKMSEDGVTNAHKSPPKGKPKNRALYADPDHYKYPIDRKHIHAAISYYNHDGMQSKGGYSDSEWASIGRRIAEAANRLIGKGYSYADGKVQTPSTHKMSTDPYDPEDSPEEIDGVATPHTPDDTDAGKYTEPAGGVVLMAEGITMADWEAAQAKIRALEEAERRHKFTEQVRGWLFNEATQTGKLLPAQQDKAVELMMSMTDEQVAKFAEFVDGLPAAVSFGEIGTSASPRGRTPNEDQVLKLAEKYEREEHMTFHDAFIRAADELGVK
ncbi:MAG: phage protease [Alicyclobacillus sp.]|nr:phage protease [Alicyclobacillus sp.]